MRAFYNVLVFSALVSGILGCSGAPEVRTVSSLDFDWRFMKTDSAFDGSHAQVADSSWRLLDLPHDWSIEDSVKRSNPSGESGGFFGGGIAWYRKHLFFPAEYKEKSVFITFDGVYMIWDVFVNGKKIGSQSNGYITRTFNITAAIKPGEENIIAVRVDNSVQPFDRWYTGCGIYRHVWLTVTNKLHVPPSGTYITTPDVSESQAKVNLKVKIKNDGAEGGTFSVKTEIRNASGSIVATQVTSASASPGHEVEVDQHFDIIKPSLWSPDIPDMYKAVTSLVSNNGVQDQYTTPFGIRQVQFKPDSGFVLNNRKIVLKGVCLHHDLGGVGSAFHDKIMLRRLQTLKEMGCNAIRLSHNPYAPQLLQMCDSLGFLVFNEAFDRWEARVDRSRSNAVSFRDSWQDDLRLFVERDRNHPSVVIWSVGNETYEQQIKHPRGIEIIKELVGFVHQLDPSRKVTSAMHPGFLKDPEQFEISNHTDVASYNYSTRMFKEWRKKSPGKIYLSSETKVYTDEAPLVLDEKPDFRGNSWFALNKQDCGQFIWTGIDYFGESPGWPFRGFPWAPINTCGYRKSYSYFTESLYSERPMVHIAVFDRLLSDSLIRYESWSKSWTGPPFVSHWNPLPEENDSITVLTFTSAESVRLFINNVDHGEKQRQNYTDGVIRWKVPYKKGVIKAVAKNGPADVAVHQLTTATAPAGIGMETRDKTISADRREIAVIEVTITDKAGVRVPYAANNIVFDVDGPADILAVDNGDLRQHFLFNSNSVPASDGRCQLIIRSTGERGRISISADGVGLSGSEIEITAR